MQVEIYANFGKYIIKCNRGVIHPGTETSAICNILLDRKLHGLSVLVVGCGAGLIPVVCADLGAYVLATDISDNAVKTTELNLLSNCPNGNWRCLQTDMFGSLQPNTFDYIIMNPPQLPAEVLEEIDYWVPQAHDGGSDGRLILDRFLSEAPTYLKKNDGKLIFSQFAFHSTKYTSEILYRAGVSIKFLASLQHPLGSTSFPRRRLWGSTNMLDIKVHILEGRIGGISNIKPDPESFIEYT